MYYLSGFEASDPFIYLRKKSEDMIIVPQLEYSRAKEEADVDKVISSSEYLEGESRGGKKKQIKMIQKIMKEEDIERLAVPEEFPLRIAEEIKKKSWTVKPIPDKVMDARKVKTSEELEKLEKAQKTTEEAMKKVEKILKDSEIKNEKLIYEEEVLTSERVKKIIKKFLIDKGCSNPEETIVASGKEGYKPHSTGTGPIKKDQLIVVDIFPRKDNTLEI